ncbi:MAG: orotidine-5'-phosphate decarboxylase [Bdellovibrionales bacterium]|nr:orotidine-5'-phosphate decarboxylase [Bdellovibrionales bacterium]
MKKAPVFLALDVNNADQALSLVKQTHPYIFGYKISPRLLFGCGMDIVRNIQPYGKVFLDFKFHDIPSTTVEAVRSAFHLGVDYVTVHSSVGGTTLKQLAALEAELNQTRKFCVLGVTVLSSISGSPDAIHQQVEILAEDVFRSGLKGLVCSPWEVESLKAKYPQAFLVTPGIRFEGDSPDDQARVMRPLEAMKKGSSALVIGRSLLREPVKRSQELAKSLADFC